ncbi:hypothetical protein, variant [Cladophialophora immunda]|uniref:Tachykinin family protein n=1 Tax=Cladophialophora immunda TaxID=569365 RepID=A0A0D2A0J6_9EURO|nr:uncharacterized protein PV07_00753 [Cladophialophora immunda]XP_016254157.1 hypothetical protein, variant [Cladophialophora immunda]KIW33940.1 hypothetical protein PV07_00753 [Cladophialophora immunda]KIW33941.1 hypothetical protein, variant [Cladophialophora immunda]OQU94507.1 hypothetical protein CLAIMM_00859 [Cladophialophora immunda]
MPCGQSYTTDPAPEFRFVDDEALQSVKTKHKESAARRAHAARVAHQRRRERQQREHETTSTGKNGLVSESETVDLSPPSEFSFVHEGDGDTGRGRVEVPAKQQVHDLTVAQRNPSPAYTAAILGRRLDQGGIDPFDQIGARDLPRALRYTLEYAFDVYWPANVNSAPSDQSYSLILRRGATRYPHAFHGLVASAAMFLQRSTQNRQVATACSALVRTNRAKAIQLINEELKQLQGAVPSDDLVMAMVAVARGSVAHARVPPASSISKSPLARAQNLHFYSTQSLEPGYIKAFFDIIDLKGGLAGVETPALATLAEFFDLTVSTLTSHRPRYDWRHPRRPLLTYEVGGLIIDPISAMLLKDLGSGFDRNILLDLYPTLNMICELIIALDRLTRKAVPEPAMHDLVNARNAIQHALCRAQRFANPASLEQAIYDTTRAALLCFSDMVIFPIPTSTSVRLRLATELHASLSACEAFDGWCHGFEGFKIWATTIGAIAAINLPLKGSFLDMLHGLLSMGYWSWEILRMQLHNFVWWDYMCDELGQTVHAEAIRIAPFPTPPPGNQQTLIFRSGHPDK